ncbi:hypothetical protein TWF506_006309 [Arthrobotrys conoides]|uniref:Uncharacterized protein n=1 Tax=Arthrobotrys conoides TaxID=74498 RepID=A0AAN8NBW1_9PEZI
MSNTTPGTPSQQAIVPYDDNSNHHISDDTVWTYNGCTFKRITKKEKDGNIVELRNGGVLSCPICPEIGVMTTLSNLIGHLVAKNHAQRFYHLWSLRGSGNNNAEPMLLFQENWEIANHLKILRSKRLEKIDRAVLAEGEYTWSRLKERFNHIAEGQQDGTQVIRPEQLFMPEFEMLRKFKGVDNYAGGPGYSGISSVRTSGQQIVTSVFRQAKEKMTGVKGPLSEIADNPRKRRAPEEENETAVFKVPKRPYIYSDSSAITDQTTNKEDEQQDIYESPKVADTPGIQFLWTDEQIAHARALKAKVANSEELTPEEEESYKGYQQLCFLLDTFQEMGNGESSGTHML